MFFPLISVAPDNCGGHGSHDTPDGQRQVGRDSTKSVARNSGIVQETSWAIPHYTGDYFSVYWEGVQCNHVDVNNIYLLLQLLVESPGANHIRSNSALATHLTINQQVMML